MPVVGYLILFNANLQDELKLSVDFGFTAADSFSVARLYFLYFGLAAMGVASLWFQVRCPEVIKAHGSAYEFIAKEASAVSQHRADQMLEWIIYHQYGHILDEVGLTARRAIALSPQSGSEEVIRKLVDDPAYTNEKPYREPD